MDNLAFILSVFFDNANSHLLSHNLLYRILKWFPQLRLLSRFIPRKYVSFVLSSSKSPNLIFGIVGPGLKSV